MFVSSEDYSSRKKVVADYPSAAKIVKVFGGWMVFQFYTDYHTWLNQK